VAIRGVTGFLRQSSPEKLFEALLHKIHLHCV